MRLQNREVAASFRQIAAWLESGETDNRNPQVVRHLADAVDELPFDMDALALPAASAAHLDIKAALPHLGEQAAHGLARYLESGELPELRNIATTVRPVLTELLRADTSVPGARALGPAQPFEKPRDHMDLPAALQVSEALVGRLARLPFIDSAFVIGDCRRARPTVSRLDILAVATAPVAAREALASLSLLANSTQTAAGTFILQADNTPVAVRVVADGSQPAALVRYTGSPAHCAAIDRLAKARNLQLTTAGIFQDGVPLAVRDERDVYDLLGLDWIEPELREDRGEVEAARDGALPRLVDADLLRGDLHCRPENPDALAAMMDIAEQRGYEYLAVVVPGDVQAAKTWLDVIRTLEARAESPRLLSCVECRISEMGEPELPDEVLALVDMTICSVQSNFQLGQRQQTDRVVRAIAHPACNIFAFPGMEGRGSEARCLLDIERVMRAARHHGCCLEINRTTPAEVAEIHWRVARHIGVKMTLGSAAQRPAELDELRFSLLRARRSWLEAKHVLNTRPLAELLPALRCK